MKYTQVPTDTFKNLQLNAGFLTSEFDPTDGSVTAGSILGATTGGVNFTATPTYVDFGEDVDNVPANTKELKKLDSWAASMSGTFVTVTSALTKTLLGAADTASNKVTPRADLLASDFDDIWWVGDYSDVNVDSGSGANSHTAGFVAIHMMNSLSTGGFQIQSADKGKGNFAFTFEAHYSMSDISTVPFEIYVKAGK